MKVRATISAAFALAAMGCAHAQHPEVSAAAASGPAARLARSVNFPTAGHRAGDRGRKAIDVSAGWMIENPSAVVVLEGHCDERGSSDYNLELGDRRARWVMGELMEEGVEASRLIVLSRGEEEPIDSRHDGAAWRRNRRVEFIPR